MLLPAIDNKEIIPVRMIPIITAGRFGQQTIAGILSHKLRADGFPLSPIYSQFEEMVDGCLALIEKASLFGPNSRDVEIYAYHIDEAGSPVKMLPDEWDMIYREISVQEPLLKNKEQLNGVPDSYEAEWFKTSLKILPPGVFVWREDLDKLWQAYTNYTLSIDGHEYCEIINYGAYIKPKYKKLILEGLETYSAPTTTNSSVRVENIQTEFPVNQGVINAEVDVKSELHTKVKETLLKMVIVMAMDCYGYQPNGKRNTATTDICNALDLIGLSLSENTVRSYLKEASKTPPKRSVKT